MITSPGDNSGVNCLIKSSTALPAVIFKIKRVNKMKTDKTIIAKSANH